MSKITTTVLSAIMATSGLAALASPASAASFTPAEAAALSVTRDAIAIAGMNGRSVTARDIHQAVSEGGDPGVQISDNLGHVRFHPRTVRFMVRTDVNATETVCVHVAGPTGGTWAPTVKACPDTDLYGVMLSDQTSAAIAATTGQMAVVVASSNNHGVETFDVSFAAEVANATIWVGPGRGTVWYPAGHNLHMVHVLDNLGSTMDMARYAVRTGSNTFSVQCVSFPTGVGGNVTSISCPNP